MTVGLITAAMLAAAKAANPVTNTPGLQAAADRWGINTAIRVASWLPMLLVESGGLTRMSEDMYYTSAEWLHQVFPSHFASAAAAQPYTRNPEKLGDLVYAAIGGYAARGFGWGQLTGLANHGAYATASGRSLADARAAMQTPAGAADSAGWFFAMRGCAAAADRGDLLDVRRLWTGCYDGTPLGWSEAEKWHGQVVAAMSGKRQAAATPPAKAAAALPTADDFNQQQLDTISERA